MLSVLAAVENLWLLQWVIVTGNRKKKKKGWEHIARSAGLDEAQTGNRRWKYKSFVWIGVTCVVFTLRWTKQSNSYHRCSFTLAPLKSKDGAVPYLDDLAWHERQLLCGRVVVGGHCSRVVRVEGHEESQRGPGQLTGRLQLPFGEFLRRGDPHLIWEYQNVQLQPRLHWQQPERSPVHGQMASVDGRPLLTLILIWGNEAQQKEL